jgi:hypothetical protein
MDDTTIAAMRDWIEDCGESTVGRSDGEIVEAVERNYEGGIYQFLMDS